MKTLIVYLVLLVMFLAAAQTGLAQNVNWRALRSDEQNLLHLNVGYDYGASTEIAYGRFVDLGRPVLLGLDFSAPMGGDLLDDFKLRLGVQSELVRSAGFSATLRAQSSLRRYENALVRIASFGADFAAVSGYYAQGWYAAGEFGFDKSITSHLKHSSLMKSYFPGIRDGWYIPSGGHFYYGVQGGASLGSSLDLTLRAGATNAQGSDEDAVLPWYAQLGLGIRF